MQKLGVVLFALLFAPGLLYAAPKNKEAPVKQKTELEREWENFKYYRTRFATDKKAHEEEKIKEEKIRLVQNLPVAKDGLPVLSSNPDGTTNAAVEVAATPGGVASVEGAVDAVSLIEAEKKRLAEEQKAKELEAIKAKLLGDQRDASGQVIDEDPVLDDDDKSNKKKKKKKKKKKRGEDDE